MSDNSKTLGLYSHNLASYQKITTAYNNSEKVVGIVHATGTGKNYNALELALNNPDKKIIFVVPSKGIIEHLINIINDNPTLDLTKDFSHVTFKTYQSFIYQNSEELASIPCDLLILDEFQHLGAPVWGQKIITFIETHPNIQILGMTAYTVRDRNTKYERDMANPLTNELFSNKIVSYYNLCDAMLEGVLPKPIYKSAYTNLLDIAEKIEEKINKLNISSKKYQEYLSIMQAIKKRIHEAESIPSIIRKNIKPNGKYIYFCPPNSIEGTNDIETIKKEAFGWFKSFIPEENIVFYTSTSDMGLTGKLNREAFYQDISLSGKKVDNKLRVMFAINQYNEGIHAPNIDGVIMGRATSSDIVYFEQLGRALSVRGNTKELFNKLETFSKENLLLMCQERDIPTNDTMDKETLIEKLLAPLVLDLTNNYDFIKNLENKLQAALKEYTTSSNKNPRNIKIRDVSFDIEMENKDLYEMLKELNNKLSLTWIDYYELAKNYYEHHGNLEIPNKFKTNDGYTYDEFGNIKLGYWLHYQKLTVPQDSEKGRLLKAIGLNFTKKSITTWEEFYKYAQNYYEHYGNLEVPCRFRTNDGYTYTENGKIGLGAWLVKQRRECNPSSKEGKALSQIGMRFYPKASKPISWDIMYAQACTYFNYHHNLNVPYNFCTNDGYTYDELGKYKLGMWLNNQRIITAPTSLKGQKLQAIGFDYSSKYEEHWESRYNLAKAYYEQHGNLNIPRNYITSDNIKLGEWLSNQKRSIKPGSIHYQKLQEIGFIFDNVLDINWLKMYNLAKTYYEEHGNLEVPKRYKTPDNLNLGIWISTQRAQFSTYSEERQTLLKQIGLRTETKQVLSWEEMYSYAQEYYNINNNLLIPTNYVTNNGIKLGQWLKNQRLNTNPNSNHGIMLSNIGMIWNIKENNKQLLKICLENNIDLKANKLIISKMSALEFQAKINYLKSYNIPLTNKLGILHEIFNINNETLLTKYNLTLSDLLKNYNLNEPSKTR